MTAKWKEPSDVFWNEIIGEASVNGFLDVGTGLTGVVGLHYVERRVKGRKVAIDIFKVRDLPQGWETFIVDARKMYAFFEQKSFDVVQACDFIEHLTKDDGIRWLQDAEKVARRYVLIFTPSGLVDSPSSILHPENPYEKHLSGWTKQEFLDLGYNCLEWNGYIIAWKELGGTGVGKRLPIASSAAFTSLPSSQK
jgi:hypothetical protein